MNDDTIRIERPFSCRRQEDRGGRVKQDPQGNVLKVRTRAHDSAHDLAQAWPELGEESKGIATG